MIWNLHEFSTELIFPIDYLYMGTFLEYWNIEEEMVPYIKNFQRLIWNRSGISSYGLFIGYRSFIGDLEIYTELIGGGGIVF